VSLTVLEISFDNPVHAPEFVGLIRGRGRFLSRIEFCKRIDLATRVRGSWFERELDILQAKAQELLVYSANRGALKRAAQS
jgi:hypothetical protein